MTKKNEGSSLLFSMMIMVMVTLWLTSLWRTSLLSFERMVEKKRYEQLRISTEGLMRYGIVFCREHFFDLTQLCTIKKEGHYCLIFDKWLTEKTFFCDGSIEMYALHSKVLKLTATLKDGMSKKVLLAISCLLTQQESAEEGKIKNIEVSNWLCGVRE